MSKNLIERINNIKYQIKQVEQHLNTSPDTADEMLSYLQSMLNELGENINSLSQVTSGDFQEEKDAEKFFDEQIERFSKFFIAEKQVKGRHIYDDKPQTPDQHNGQNLKPDRILYPTKEAFTGGWKYGPIGVELKKSNIKIGPVFTQVLEQRQALYYSKHLNGARIMPIIFAIFPTDDIKFDIHSLSERQSIVSCQYNEKYDQIQFGTHSRNILSIGENEIWVNNNWIPSTSKGHQGSAK